MRNTVLHAVITWQTLVNSYEGWLFAKTAKARTIIEGRAYVYAVHLNLMLQEGRAWDRVVLT